MSELPIPSSREMGVAIAFKTFESSSGNKQDREPLLHAVLEGMESTSGDDVWHT
jgi:hypothetical protein